MHILLPVSELLIVPDGSIGPLVACYFDAFLERIVRWAAEALFALTTMTACSQHVELRAA